MKIEVTQMALNAIKVYANLISYCAVEKNNPMDILDYPELEDIPTFNAAVSFLESNGFVEVRFGFIHVTDKLRERVSKTLKQEQERKAV